MNTARPAGCAVVRDRERLRGRNPVYARICSSRERIRTGAVK